MRTEPASPSRRRRVPLWVLVVASVLLFAAPPGAHAQDASPETVAHVEALLSGFEHAPSADEWRAVGEDGAAALLAIAADDTRRATTRARAISALRHFPSPETTARLQAMIDGQVEVPAILVRKSVGTLAVVAPELVVTSAPAALASSDVSTREAAVGALVEIGGPGAADVLHAHYDVETSEHVRALIVDAVGVPPVDPVSPGTDQPGPKE